MQLYPGLEMPGSNVAAYCNRPSCAYSTFPFPASFAFFLNALCLVARCMLWTTLIPIISLKYPNKPVK